MQLKVPAAFMIYAGSYLPLSMILLVQDYDPSFSARPVCSSFRHLGTECSLPFRNPSLSVFAFIFCALCVALTFLLFRLVRPKQEIDVLTAKHVPADLMNYVLPYVVSFMSLDYADKAKFSGFIIFFLWIFWITYRSGQVVMNPMLTVFGWRLYEIDYSFHAGENEYSGLALSNISLTAGQNYRRALVQDVLVIKVAPEASNDA